MINGTIFLANIFVLQNQILHSYESENGSSLEYIIDMLFLVQSRYRSVKASKSICYFYIPSSTVHKKKTKREDKRLSL